MKCIINLLFLSAISLNAQNIDFSYGKTNQQSYAYEASYNQKINTNYSTSILYINEGHINNNHKDDIGLIINKDINLNRLDFSLGIGATYCFDTKYNTDIHSIESIADLSIRYFINDNYYTKLTINQTKNTSLLVGIGYNFNESSKDIENKYSKNNEISIFKGQSILNKASCPTTSTSSIEYNHNINNHMDFTTSFINENIRQGITSQIWVTNTINSFTFKAGIGPYETSKLNTLTSFQIIKKLNKSYSIKALFDRVITDNNKDADIFMLGIGYNL